MKTKRWIGCCSWWYKRNTVFHIPHSSEPHQGAWRRKVSSRCPSQTPCSAPLCDYLPEFEVIFSALYHMYDFSYSIIVCFFAASHDWQYNFVLIFFVFHRQIQTNHSKSTNQGQLNLRCQLWISSYMPAHVETEICPTSTARTDAVPVKADAWGRFMPNRNSALDIWSLE